MFVHSSSSCCCVVVVVMIDGLTKCLLGAISERIFFWESILPIIEGITRVTEEVALTFEFLLVNFLRWLRVSR